jgi:GNAT superfamily N-acetyltransferase
VTSEIEATLIDDDPYSDGFVIEVLDEQLLGCPGVSNYAGHEYWTFVWRDQDQTPLGVLFIDNEAARRGVIAGNEFTILVHPAWRRRGIATELLRAAGDHFSFELARNPLYTQVGAAWANRMLRECEMKLVQ